MPKITYDKVLRRYSITEKDGTVTRISIVHGVDLAVTQEKPGQKKMIFSTYGDPGTAPYALFLKFAYMTRLPFQGPSENEQPNPSYARDAKSTASVMAQSPFPRKFAGGGDDIVEARLVLEGRKPLIEMECGKSILTFSPTLIRTLIRTIPKLYQQVSRSGEGIFGLIHATIRDVHRKGEIDMFGKSKITRRETPMHGKQGMLFEEERPKQRDAKPPKPEYRARPRMPRRRGRR